MDDTIPELVRKTNYTLTFHRSNDVVVRHFAHDAGLAVLSALIAKQGFLLIPEESTDALGSVHDPMTVFTSYIISLHAHPAEQTSDIVATGSALGSGHENL